MFFHLFSHLLFRLLIIVYYFFFNVYFFIFYFAQHTWGSVHKEPKVSPRLKRNTKHFFWRIYVHFLSVTKKIQKKYEKFTCHVLFSHFFDSIFLLIYPSFLHTHKKSIQYKKINWEYTRLLIDFLRLFWLWRESDYRK